MATAPAALGPLSRRTEARPSRGYRVQDQHELWFWPAVCHQAIGCADSRLHACPLHNCASHEHVQTSWHREPARNDVDLAGTPRGGRNVEVEPWRSDRPDLASGRAVPAEPNRLVE